MEEKSGASCWPWTTKRLRVVGFGWWSWMGTPDINGSIQSTSKNQCKSSFSLSLLWQGRPFGAILHAKTEAATLSCYPTRLWGSCQMDYSPNGKIRNQAGWWIHGSSTPGDESLYLNHIENLPSFQEFYAGWSSHSILFFFLVILIVQEVDQPKKKASAQRNVLASVLRLQRKFVKTVNESMDELNRRRKSLWWSRWIPREE